MEYEDQTKRPCKLEVHLSHKANFSTVVKLRVDSREIFIGNFETKRKHYPGKIPNSRTDKEDNLYRKKIDTEDDTA